MSTLTRLVNLTPHAINILAEDKTPHFTLSPSGKVARIFQTRQMVDVLYTEHHPEGMAVFSTKCGDIVDLPAEQADTFYVVSAMVKNAAQDRYDLLSPGELVRDDKGQPIGCIGLDL